MKPKRLAINIRGTNGSGKSTVMFALMEKYGRIPLRDGGGQIWAYRLLCRPRCYVLGRYETPTGGCDTIRGYPGVNTGQAIQDGIEELLKDGNVIFEGLLMSGYFTRWIDLAKARTDTHFIFATLDTPLDMCIKRVLKRRESSKIKRSEFDPERSLVPKHKSVLTAQKKFEEAGLDSRILPHDKALKTIITWMKDFQSHEHRFD